MPMSLTDVGKNYCTNFQKTSIDYNVNEGHKATKEEIEYCINDCKVLEEGYTNYLNSLADVLEENKCVNTLKKLHKKLTNAGIAFEAFKELSTFEQMCPKTTSQEYLTWKGAYKGGYVYSNPNGIVKDVNMIDCNSMYPFIYANIDMPFGKGYQFNDWENLKRFKFYIVNIYIKYDLKNGYIPIIGGGLGKYGGTNYKNSSNGEFEPLTVCNIDLELIQEFYDCEIILCTGWGFYTKEKFFKKYADTFIKVKNKEKGIKRQVAKVLLNSPYGKTGMNGITELKRYYIDEDDILKSEITGYTCDDNIFQYLPIAIQVTAGARRLLLTTARNIGFNNVHYMDTDSIKFSGPITIPTDPNILGAWKDEGHAELFKTIAPKKYVYYENGVLHYTCAGFNKKVLTESMLHNLQVDKESAIKYINKFNTGLELDCLQSKVVSGGRALIPVKKEIK